MDERIQLEMEVQDALGFIALLQEARAAKMLAAYELNRSQFTLLFLLGHDQEADWTISSLAEHLEMQPPGISKMVSQLESKGWLAIRPDMEDRRKRIITITSEGIEKRECTLAAMVPFVSNTFSDWSDKELSNFLSHLEKLKGWLDVHRNAF
jgi:DNA-binding MarR family transcriptional regulator